VIDLGHISAPDVPSWPSERRVSRAWIGFVVAVGVMLAVGGPAVPADPMPLVTSLPIGTSAHVTVHGDQVFVVDTVGTDGRLTAYGLPGGDRQWTASAQGRTENADMFMSKTGIVVLTQDRYFGDVDVQGFDQSTGDARWSIEAYGVTRIGPDLLLSVPTDGLVRVGSGNTIERVDLETGRVEWSMAVPNNCETAVSDVGDVVGTGLVEMCADQGLLMVRDLDTGRVAATLKRKAVRDSDRGWFFPGLLVVDGVVVVTTRGNQNTVTTAYRTKDLTRLWSIEQDSYVQLSDCAPKVCVQSPSGISTLDPLTGRPVSIPPPPAAPDNAPHPKVGVLEFLVVPVGARPALDPDRSDVMVSQAVPEGRSMALPGYFPGSETITWIAVQEGRAFRPVASLHGVGAGCRFEAAYVMCVTGLERITLWHLMIR
jgi:outer membrane protein assembly factor BamB